jgi:hypothetical protein
MMFIRDIIWIAATFWLTATARHEATSNFSQPLLPSSSSLSSSWTANDLQKVINSAIRIPNNSSNIKTIIHVPPGDYFFGRRSLNITHAQNLTIVPNKNSTGNENITLWFSGDAGINISHSVNVQIGQDSTINTTSGSDGVGRIIIDYDPPPPPQPTFRETSGITLHMYNCTRISVHNLVIRAAPFMAVTAFHGGGDHSFHRLTFELTNRPSADNTTNVTTARNLVGVRDALHFSDLRKGPTIVDSTIGYTGDDFFNVHNTLLLVLQCKYALLNNTQEQERLLECLLVNPRVTVDAERETVYGTFSILKFVQPNRDTMSFYAWPATDMILYPSIQGATVQSIVDVSDSFGNTAQKTLPPMLMHPPTMSWMEATNQTTKFSANEVWKVALRLPPKSTVAEPPLPPPPMLGSIVSIDTLSSEGAKIINNTFTNSDCNIGRFKSSGGVIQGNVFRKARIHNLEISALPQFFEGPVDVQGILVADNWIEEEETSMDPIIHCGPLCEKRECHPGECDACPSCTKDTFWAKNINLRNNTIYHAGGAIALEPT